MKMVKKIAREVMKITNGSRDVTQIVHSIVKMDFLNVMTAHVFRAFSSVTVRFFNRSQLRHFLQLK